IDVDDFVSPATIERADDLRDQRRDIVRFVAHGHNDGNGDRFSVGGRQIGTHRGVGLKEHKGWNKAGTGISPALDGVRFYGAKAPRATLLRRPDEGPTSGTIVP